MEMDKIKAGFFIALGVAAAVTLVGLLGRAVGKVAK